MVQQDFLEKLATPYALNALQELFNLQVLSRQARQTNEQRRILADRHSSANALVSS